jgi:hypothetical protein
VTCALAIVAEAMMVMRADFFMVLDIQVVIVNKSDLFSEGVLVVGPRERLDFEL